MGGPREAGAARQPSRPHGDAGRGHHFALDVENRRILVNDLFADELAGVDVGPNGLSVAWRRPMLSIYFASLVGSAANRELVLPDFNAGKHRLTWIDVRTGSLVARTQPVSGNMTSSYVVPGFDGRYFHITDEGGLYSVRAVR